MSKAQKSTRNKTKSADSQRASADFVNEPAGQRSSKRVYALWLLLLAIALVAWFSGTPSRLVTSYVRGVLAKFELDAAEKWLNIADAYLPSDPVRELLQARIARKKSDYASMDKHLAKAKLLGADATAVQIEEAMAAAQSGALELVEVQLFKWLESGVGDIDEISDAYANGLAANSRFETLNQVLDAWQRDYPNDPRPDYRRGRVHEYFQLWQQAEEAYKKSLSRNSSFYPSRYRLGRVLILQRKMEEAQEEFRLCTDMHRPEAAMTSLAICYRSLGGAKEAKALLEEVLKSTPEQIAESYDALEESPEYFEAASNLGDLESEAGNYAEAEKWLRLALEKNKRDLQSRYSLAVTLRELGRVDEAQKEFDFVTESRKALEQVNPLRNQIVENPQDPALRVKLGELLLTYESERNGRFWISSAFSIDPNYRPAHEALAKHYQEQSISDTKLKALADYHTQAAKAAAP